MTVLHYHIWCDVHGTVHDRTNDPYAYGYKQTGEKPECSESDWRELVLGDPVHPICQCQRRTDNGRLN